MLARITLVVFLFSYGASYGQSVADSLYLALNKTKGTKKVDLLTELALAYRTTSFDSVSKYAKKALRLSTTMDYPLGISKSYRVVGLANSLLSKHDSALIYYQKALELLPVDADKMLDADIKMGIGGELYYSSQLDKAVEMFIDAASTFERLGEVTRSAAAYSNIGMILNSNDQDEKAKQYFHKALKLADTYNLMGTKLPTLVNMSSLFLKNEMYDSAIYYANECYEISKEKNMSYGMARALVILSEAYSNKGMFEKGLSTSKEGEALFEEMDNQKLLRSMQHKEAVALKGLHKDKQALEIALNVLENIEENESLAETLYLFIHDTYLEIGDTSNALKFYKLFFEEYKKTEIKHHEALVAELETKYETEKKSREIQALYNKAKIQELTIRQQNSVIAIAAVAFLFIVILLLLFFRQRSLRRNNELLSLQQKFLRSQLNPHFIFNALTGIQNFVMKNDPMRGGSYIAKFSKLMRQVLEHSRAEFIPFEEELQSLTNYMDLQQLRFENKFEYVIEVDESIDHENLKLPPMFAQPFIENALEHGISNMENGSIDIFYAQESDYLKLDIKDNGIGLKPNKDTTHKSRAIEITQARMKLLSGKRKKKLAVTVKNMLDGAGKVKGVHVTLMLPYIN